MLFFNPKNWNVPKLLWLEASIPIDDTEVTFNDEIEAVFEGSLKPVTLLKKDSVLVAFSVNFEKFFSKSQGCILSRHLFWQKAPS